MRYIEINENGKVRRNGYCPNGKLPWGCIESEIGTMGQLLQEDGSFINDPQDEIDRQNSLNIQIKNQSYLEFKEMSDIYGVDSPEAISAKQAYIDASNNITTKSRYELESEISSIPSKIQDAVDAYTIELIEGGDL